MADCLKCANHAAYTFRVLEVRTLHVRDITGEKRVQALGDFKDYAVCKNCADAYLEKVKNPGAGLFKRCATFVAVLAFGLLLTIAFWPANYALRLMGISAIICGVIGLISSLQDAQRQQKVYANLDDQQAEALAAWEVLLQNTPKKSADADLTYIPVDKKTLMAKNGDLMILYDLLPDIAIQTYNLLHAAP